MTMIAPEQAQQNMESSVAAVRDEALRVLSKGGGGLALPHLLSLLVQETGQPLELVSRALARLLTTDALRLTADRRVELHT